MPQLLGPIAGGGGGGVVSVTATPPLTSSGGANPDISLGVVPATKGGTGLTTSGALGNVLTSDGAGGWVSSTPAAGASTFAATCLAGDVVGALVYIAGADVAGVAQVASANASNAAKMPVVGAIVAKATATACTVQRFGRIDVSATGAVLVAGNRYFVGFSGEPISPPPTAATSPSGYVLLQPVGVATSTTILECQPSQTLLRDNV